MYAPAERAAVLVRARAEALATLPQRQALWVVAAVATTLGLYAAGLWTTDPELCLLAGLALGPLAASPRRLWALPLSMGAVLGTGLAIRPLGASPVVAGALAAGAIAAWALPQSTTAVDVLHGALASAAGAGLGLLAAVGLVPQLHGGPLGAALAALLVALAASQGLLPVAWRLDHDPLPSRRQIRRALAPAYRPPVDRAFDLCRSARPHAPDPSIRAGLAEVALWVFRLQLTLQTLDRELGGIDPVTIGQRIAACEAEASPDPFTEERRRATAAHLRRLLDHRVAIEQERRRTHALVEYALAYLEEARAGLAIARELPGEAMPDRLSEVLHRLRGHTEAGDARRQTTREMASMQV